jgi:NADH:ubiquinone oxidoreductase subunit D
MSRSTGLKRDIRLDKIETYANYYYLNFRGYIGQNGDSYDRFLIRMNEMSESLNIIAQIINKIYQNKKKTKKKLNSHQILAFLNKNNIFKKNINNSYKSMEELINRFKY